MPWTPLDSSMLSAFDYDQGMSVLHLRFSNGSTYAYQNVPPEIVKGLTESDSAGKFFHTFIKDRFVAR